MVILVTNYVRLKSEKSELLFNAMFNFSFTFFFFFLYSVWGGFFCAHVKKLQIKKKCTRSQSVLVNSFPNPTGRDWQLDSPVPVRASSSELHSMTQKHKKRGICRAEPSQRSPFPRPLLGSESAPSQRRRGAVASPHSNQRCHQLTNPSP